MSSESIRAALQGAIDGWLLRAATASCLATLIAMEAALDGVELSSLEVTVDSQSDDLGIVDWARAHCPVTDLTTRAVPLAIETEVV